ncbi:MAG: hypothetical protein LBR37_02305 [Erysipelotrichaceae bacterium]|nr:hypothetical protein [Erysipelotrichaceae bacterium]
MKKTIIRKITLTAILTILVIIFTKVLSIQNPPFPIPPFVRISIGPALIIFASIYLGPFFGALVGVLSDVLGWVAFNFSGLSFSPLITIIYLFLGILPWVINRVLTKISFMKIDKTIFIILLLFMNLYLGFFFVSEDSFMVQGIVYNLNITLKIVLFCASILISILTYVVTYLIDKKYHHNTFQVAIVTLISEILLMVILGSYIKAFFFGASFFFVLVSQILVLFINVPLNTFMVSLLQYLLQKRRKTIK